MGANMKKELESGVCSHVRDREEGGVYAHRGVQKRSEGCVLIPVQMRGGSCVCSYRSK